MHFDALCISVTLQVIEKAHLIHMTSQRAETRKNQFQQIFKLR